MLVNFIIAKFQSKKSNPNGGQIIFTTHNTELMNLEFMRKDQIYFADKKRSDGSSATLQRDLQLILLPRQPIISGKAIWLENMVPLLTLRLKR